MICITLHHVQEEYLPTNCSVLVHVYFEILNSLFFTILVLQSTLHEQRQ